MTYFKKFTDFCGGAAAFLASLYFFRMYKQFDPVTDEGAPGKLEQFLEPTSSTDHRLLIPLICLLAFSVLVGCVFRRLPSLCFAVSLLPTLLIFYMFEKKLLYEQPFFYVSMGCLHVLGNMVECILRDKEDHRHRMFWLTKISAAGGAALCFLVKYRTTLPFSDEIDKLSLIESELMMLTPEQLEPLMALAIMFLALVVVGSLLYNVYLIDALLSFVPLVFTIRLLYTERLPFAPFAFLMISVFCVTANLLLLVFENNLSRREQIELLDDRSSIE